jgi:hypothetical protein
VKPIQLTQHDGKRLGLPPFCAMMIAQMTEAARNAAKAAEAKTLIVADLGLQQRLQIMVRDEFRQVLNLFPIAHGGRPWQQVLDGEKMSVAFPKGSIAAWQELREDVFALTIDISGTTLTTQFMGTFEELEQLLDDGDTAPAAEPA